MEESCPVHSKKCRLVEFNHGLVCHLHVISNDDAETSQSAASQAAQFGSCPMAEEEDTSDEEMEFDPEEERRKASKETEDASLNLCNLEDAALTREQQQHSTDEEASLPMQCFPSFAMAGEDHYILLTDRMHELNIREDYCLAAIADFCEADMGFVADDVDHLQVDTDAHDTELIPGEKLLEDAFHEAKAGEAELPTDEQLQMTTAQLRLEGMGILVASTTDAQRDKRGSIELWTRSKLEMDENQMDESSPYTAMLAAQDVAQNCKELGITILHIKLRVTGGNKTKTPGPGAKSALQAHTRSGMRIGQIEVVIPIPTDGTRRKGGRRGCRL
ncbi:hypothetical protein L7F22_003908 [Adiantum nelumboides]|nr:hypothetical protein [Adiantum nelumboides]